MTRHRNSKLSKNTRKEDLKNRNVRPDASPYDILDEPLPAG